MAAKFLNGLPAETLDVLPKVLDFLQPVTLVALPLISNSPFLTCP